MECDFWTTNLIFFVIFCQWYRFGKLVHFLLLGVWKGRWIRSFSFHSTPSCLGALDCSSHCCEANGMYLFFFFFFEVGLLRCHRKQC